MLNSHEECTCLSHLNSPDSQSPQTRKATIQKAREQEETNVTSVPATEPPSVYLLLSALCGRVTWAQEEIQPEHARGPWWSQHLNPGLWVSRLLILCCTIYPSYKTQLSMRSSNLSLRPHDSQTPGSKAHKETKALLLANSPAVQRGQTHSGRDA